MHVSLGPHGPKDGSSARETASQTTSHDYHEINHPSLLCIYGLILRHELTRSSAAPQPTILLFVKLQIQLQNDALLYEDLVDAFYQVVETDRNDAFYSLAQHDKLTEGFDPRQYRELKIRERFASRKLWHALDLVAAIREGKIKKETNGAMSRMKIDDELSLEYRRKTDQLLARGIVEHQQNQIDE